MAMLLASGCFMADKDGYVASKAERQSLYMIEYGARIPVWLKQAVTKCVSSVWNPALIIISSLIRSCKLGCVPFL